MMGFSRLDDSTMCKIRMEYGDVLKRGSLRLEPMFLAAYFGKSFGACYDRTAKQFIKYQSDTGVWDSLTDEAMELIIHQFIRWFDQTHDYAGVVENGFTGTVCNKMAKFLKAISEKTADVSSATVYYFHAANGEVLVDKETGQCFKQEFDPELYCSNRSQIPYDPEATCPRFINELLKPAMSEDDMQHLQLYLGQCLLGENLSQTFLLLEGTPGGGKSTLVNVIEKVIGRTNCSELRTAHTSGRFETSAYLNKKLLTGKDVSSQFMNNSGARALKFLTGNDTITTESKNSNVRQNLECSFNIIITSNNTLQIKFDGDLEAWRRRILLINYANQPPVKKISNFDDQLVVEEGSGILNWMLEGACRLIKNNNVINKSEQQKASVDRLLLSSDPFTYFADLCIHYTPKAAMTSSDVVDVFTEFCHKKCWPSMSERNICKKFNKYMAEKHGVTQSHSIIRNGRSKRGFKNFQIRNISSDKVVKD